MPLLIVLPGGIAVPQVTDGWKSCHGTVKRHTPLHLTEPTFRKLSEMETEVCRGTSECSKGHYQAISTTLLNIAEQMRAQYVHIHVSSFKMAHERSSSSFENMRRKTLRYYILECFWGKQTCPGCGDLPICTL